MNDKINEQDRTQKAATEYQQLAHAMQAGVAAEMHHTKQTDPKHLRTGVNSALVDIAALAELLIKKGVITEAEYVEAIRDGMAEEVARYEARLSEHYGKPVKLH